MSSALNKIGPKVDFIPHFLKFATSVSRFEISKTLAGIQRINYHRNMYLFLPKCPNLVLGPGPLKKY
jgi:hypothetical protein